MTGTQALVLTGVGVSFAVPWLGLAIIGVALATAASETPRDTWSVFQEEYEAPNFHQRCYVVHSSRLKDFLPYEGGYILIGTYEDLHAALSDAITVCGEEDVITVGPTRPIPP